MCARACGRARDTICVGEKGCIQDGGSSSLTDSTLPCSASSLLSFLTSFDIFNYVFHTRLGTCLFYSCSSYHHSSLFSHALLSHLPILFLHLIHSISFLSGCSLLALCAGTIHLLGGQVAQRSDYFLSAARCEQAMERWSGDRGDKRVKRMLSDILYQWVLFNLSGNTEVELTPSGTENIGGHVFFSVYIILTSHPFEGRFTVVSNSSCKVVGHL